MELYTDLKNKRRDRCKAILIFTLCLVFSIAAGKFAHAQGSGLKKAMQQYDNAQVALQRRDNDSAIKALNQSVAGDSTFQAAFVLLGDIYRLKKEFDTAKLYYLKAITITAEKTEARVYYAIADAELKSGDYENAEKHFNLFKNNYKGKDQEQLLKADKFIKDCIFSLTAIKNPQKFQPLNMGAAINTKGREYFPALTVDGESMIFSRTVEGNEDFYIAHQLENKKWSVAVPLTEQINTSLNEGAQSVSPDGKYLFFTGCNREDGMGSCDLYLSYKSGNSWDKPFNLGPVVNSASWDSQPAVTPDGSTLYFASNRPGGFGGNDLWKTTITDTGDWSRPVNLGPEINTPFDESTPFIHPDGKTLYFSSNGWPGMGNMDVFYSRAQENGNWDRPVNLGYPINTFNEETALMVSPDGSQGMFSAILDEGFGDMDIYTFELPLPAKPQPITYVRGIVRDKESKKYLEAKVQLVELKTKDTKFDDYTSAQNGTFLAVMPLGSSYAFNAIADGYLFYSDNFELTKGTAKNPFFLEIYLEKLTVGGNMILKNIFFDTNKFELLPASVTEMGNLLQLLQVNTTISIEIRGHTDDTGTAAANQILSLNRAEAVYKYLINHKIAAERLSFRGLGAAETIARNDTEEGRQQNRRTSFVITKI